MFNRYLRRSKIVLVFMLVFALLLGGTSQVFAANKDAVSTPQDTEILIFLNSVAYTESIVTTGAESRAVEKNKKEAAFKAMEKQFSKMDKKAVIDEARNRLQEVIQRKEKGENINWNKDFVENIVKKELPDLYPVISEQAARQVEQPAIDTPQLVTIAAFTPGESIKQWEVYSYNTLGIELWGFFEKIKWTWDSTKITSVLPSTWGEVYSGWEYRGIIINRQEWLNNYTAFNKVVKGEFKFSFGGSNWFTEYGNHDITVRADGGYTSYSWKS